MQRAGDNHSHHWKVRATIEPWLLVILGAGAGAGPRPDFGLSARPAFRITAMFGGRARMQHTFMGAI